MIEPERFLQWFPPRPINPSEANEISANLSAHMVTIRHGPPDGEQYIPVVNFLIPEEQDDRGCAVMFWMGDDLDKWYTEIIWPDITHSQWLNRMHLFAEEYERTISDRS